MKAAQDGLLPDGREGALVVYRTKAREGGWIEKVQWMPMIAGILKKVRNSGELKSIRAHVVHENDKFRVVLGDDEKLEHDPNYFDPGKPVGVYAIAETKEEGIYREFMSFADVERVRGASRAKDSGPWVQWWGEMAKKTVLRRLAKRLPTSSDLDDLIRRDDELYDFGKDGEPARAFRPVASPLLDVAPEDAPVALDAPVAPALIDETPTVKGPVGQGADELAAAQEFEGTPAPTSDEAAVDPLAEARRHGAEAGASGRRRQTPIAYSDAELAAFLAAFDEARAAAKAGAEDA